MSETLKSAEISTPGGGAAMGIIKKNAFVFVLMLAVIYVYAPQSLEDVAKLPWLDDINIILNKSLAYTKREAGVSPVDPVAAANVDEDLDYRIAQRMKSAEGWRSFFTAIRMALMLNLRARNSRNWFRSRSPPALRRPAQASLSDIKAPSEATSSAQPSARSEVASDEICRRDADGLERLSHSPTSDEAMRFLTELRCEKLRPELFRLTERLDYQAPTAADLAIQSPSSWVAPAQVGRWRATEPQNKTHWSVSSRSPQSRRHANRWAAPSLPPILLALLGKQPRNSPASDEPKPALDWVAGLAAEERAKPCWQRISCGRDGDHSARRAFALTSSQEDLPTSVATLCF